MKIKIEAADGELETKAFELAKSVLARLAPYDRRLVKALEQLDTRYVDMIRELHGEDAEVFFRPAPGACADCLRLHVGSDGNPRIFKLSDLDVDNSGRKREEWQPVSGDVGVHPNCSCEIVHMPTGWGFASDGAIMPNAAGGERGHPLDLVKATGDRPVEHREFCGLKIGVENPAGTIRHWKDEQGREGQTTMLFDYGFIEGTRGADGGGYDCFLGPEPEASFVYIIHQRRPDTGELYDEDKVMMGWEVMEEARQAFLAHYSDPAFLGSMSQMTVPEFRAKVLQTTEPAQDGMVKTLSPGMVGQTHLADRAVATGSAGPSIAMGSPQPPALLGRDPSLMRDHVEAFMTDVAEQPMLILDMAVWNNRGLDMTLSHPRSELDAVAGDLVDQFHVSKDDLDARRAFLQGRLDRRVEAGQTTNQLAPVERIVVKEAETP